MPAAPAQKTSTFSGFAWRRGLAPLVECPTAVFYLGLAIGAIAAIAALLIIAIP